MEGAYSFIPSHRTGAGIAVHKTPVNGHDASEGRLSRGEWGRGCVRVGPSPFPAHSAYSAEPHLADSCQPAPLALRPLARASHRLPSAAPRPPAPRPRAPCPPAPRPPAPADVPGTAAHRTPLKGVPGCPSAPHGPSPGAYRRGTADC